MNATTRAIESTLPEASGACCSSGCCDSTDEAPAQDLKATVKEKYGQAALRVQDGETDNSCGGSSACCGATTEAWDPITSDLYDEKQKAGIPAEALLASLAAAIRRHSPS